MFKLINKPQFVVYCLPSSNCLIKLFVLLPGFGQSGFVYSRIFTDRVSHTQSNNLDIHLNPLSLRGHITVNQRVLFRCVNTAGVFYQLLSWYQNQNFNQLTGETQSGILVYT